MPDVSGTGLSGTGLRIDVGVKHGSDVPPPPPGQHLWSVLGVWRVIDPEAEAINLDTGNLLTVEGPGCWACGEPYTPQTAAQPCKGPLND